MTSGVSCVQPAVPGEICICMVPPGWSSHPYPVPGRGPPEQNVIVSLWNPFITLTSRAQNSYIQPASLDHMWSPDSLDPCTETMGNRNPGASKFSSFTNLFFSYLIVFYYSSNNILTWLNRTPNGIDLQILIEQISFWSIGQ